MKPTRRQVAAPGGRTLRVFDGGDRAGVPVLSHHGTPGSGLPYPPHLDAAAAHGIRLLSYDRPGYGGSARSAGRRVADAAADVEAIADGLGLERLAVWGASGGGPHALACAALLPGRVAAAASLAGVAPYGAEGLDWLAGMGEGNVQEFSAALAGPDRLLPFLRAAGEELLAAGPDGLAAALRSLLSPVDTAVLTGELGAYMDASTREAIGARLDGWVDDDVALAGPWGFDPAQIAVPVLVWQGREDRFVPAAHREWLAAHVPGAEARLTAEDGHLTLLQRRLPEVHAWLRERL